MKQSEKRLRQLADKAKFCRKCPLHHGRRTVVFGEGPDSASAMIIGEAPGEAEDATGRPFVGRTGRFLNEIFESLGLERKDIYITSTVKCRPPDNRDPKADELDACWKNWLCHQIKLIDPALLLLLGKVSCRQILGAQGALKDIRGTTQCIDGRTCLPTYHPTAAMRFPSLRKGFEEDLQRFVSLLRASRDTTLQP